MDQCFDKTEDPGKETCKTRVRFIVYLLGVILNFSTFLATINLQSSINIQEGLGTISLTTIYVTAAVFSILITPMVIRKFGAKRCIYASDAAHSAFILANFYPDFYTLIPGAIIAGIGEGMIWTCMPIMNVYFGKKYSCLKKVSGKGEDYYTTLFSGFFFSSFQLCQIFGNLISYVALYSSTTPSDEEISNITTVSSMTSNYAVPRFYYCGANDCQDPDIVGHSKDQYVPADKVTVMVLLSIFVIMCIVSVILHVVFLPDVRFPVKKGRKKEENYVVAYDNDAYNQEVNCNQHVNVDDQVESADQSSNCPTNEETHIGLLIKKSVKDLGKHLIRVKQILILPITLYNGLSMGFVFSELTRAYSSCVLGVDQIGICMAIYGCSDALLSLVAGQYGKKLGTPFFFLLALAIDIGNFTYCLLWNPNPDSSWSVYFVFFTLGFTDGIWQTLVNVMYIQYFPNNQEIAHTCWNFLIVTAFTVQFAWSSALCVNTKIYIQEEQNFFNGKKKERKIMKKSDLNNSNATF